ncbi:hypothetical protein WJ970_03035 [Achromobacter xylosoxidans]
MKLFHAFLPLKGLAGGGPEKFKAWRSGLEADKDRAAQGAPSSRNRRMVIFVPEKEKGHAGNQHSLSARRTDYGTYLQNHPVTPPPLPTHEADATSSGPHGAGFAGP